MQVFCSIIVYILLRCYIFWPVVRSWQVGTTVFCGTRNFEPSRGICPFLQNFYIFVEFRRSVLVIDKGTNTAYFGRVLAAVENLLLYLDMIAP